MMTGLFQLIQRAKTRLFPTLHIKHQEWLLARLAPLFRKQEIVTPHGMKLFLDKGDSLLLTLHQEHEPITCRQVETILREGDTVVDVGAHIGYFTTLFSKCVGKSGKVFAFEPSKSNYDLLRRNLAENHVQNVDAFNGAASRTSGTVMLREGDSDSNFKIYGGNTQAGVPTPCIPIDTYLAERGVERVRLIKIDVDGAEWLVLSGAINTIKNNRDIVVLTEFVPAWMDECARSIGETGHAESALSLLQSEGFELFEIVETQNTMLAVKREDLLRKRSRCVNLLCRRKP